ncbi:hypothetical protein [Nocardioides jejuensis]|uniref:hypothetical protein n=1 Tax=Nocardioides jejuensis TaxID=2502782 RepID=UPI0014045228|nr:hypothetical protein [Nocardioides jejuensis]
MQIRRRPVVDEVTIDGETVVLVGESALALSAPASAALGLLTGEWVDVTAWFAEVEQLLGPAPEGAGARDGLVAALVAADLVEERP